MTILPNFYYDLDEATPSIQRIAHTTLDTLGEKKSWLNFGKPPKQLDAALSKKLGIPKFIAKNILEEETRPRVLVVPEGMMMILRGINLNPGAEPDDMVSLRIWIDKQKIVTISLRRVQAIYDIQKDLKAFSTSTAPSDIFIGILEHLLAHIEEAIYSIDEQLDNIEESLDKNVDLNLVAEKIAAVRQSIIKFRRYLLPQREAISRLIYDKLTMLSESQQLYLRDMADSMNRYVEDLDAARERATVLQDNSINRLTERVNNKMYVLSIIAMIFLPATFIDGLFGMNIILPGQESHWTFWIVTGSSIVLAASLYYWLRRKRWL